MNRLTRKIKGYYSVDLRNCLPMEYEQIENSNACVDKLGKLEDIEEELGIDLITLFKALKDRQVIFKHIYGLENPKIYLETHKIAGLLFDGKNYGLWLYDNGFGDEFWVYTKDYGKTWALTKEELEDEKDNI